MITGSMFRDSIISGANNITNNRQAVDALNVFPVPDGDTGSNMILTLENGMKEFKKILDETKAAGKSAIPGDNAFYLYDTFGFPLELTVEMAGESGIGVDEDGFVQAMEAQKQKARDNQNFSAKLSADEDVFSGLDKSVTTQFVGYDRTESDARIVAMSDKETITDSLGTGDEGTIVVDITPFYATMGGQVGDKGVITADGAEFDVYDTMKLPEGRVAHIGKVIKGSFKTGQDVRMAVDALLRASTCRNHSATHLLQSALREVLGDDVHQQGSYQDPDRTRFDFSYGEAMSAEQIKEVQSIVNRKIAEDLEVRTDVMSIDEARKTGAMALFGEKYGDTVRVITAGDVSCELCGGTHVYHTGEIIKARINKEKSISSGIRRITMSVGTLAE